MSEKNQILTGLIADLPEKQRLSFEKKLSYRPKIVVCGKTGVGKSSLLNALFGKNVCGVHDVKAHTRVEQEVQMHYKEKSFLRVFDVPGVGENDERDEEYRALYARALDKTDMVLWVTKADDRTFSVDEKIYESLVRPYMERGTPFLVAVNQVDKMEPLDDWEGNKPGAQKQKNIEQKLELLCKQFGGLSLGQIVPVGATKNYGLDVLLKTMLEKLPAGRPGTFLSRLAGRVHNKHNWDLSLSEAEMLAQLQNPEEELDNVLVRLIEQRAEEDEQEHLFQNAALMLQGHAQTLARAGEKLPGDEQKDVEVQNFAVFCTWQRDRQEAKREKKALKTELPTIIAKLSELSEEQLYCAVRKWDEILKQWAEYLIQMLKSQTGGKAVPLLYQERSGSGFVGWSLSQAQGVLMTESNECIMDEENGAAYLSGDKFWDFVEDKIKDFLAMERDGSGL